MTFLEMLFRPCGAGYNPPLSPPPGSPERMAPVSRPKADQNGRALKDNNTLTPGEPINYITEKAQPKPNNPGNAENTEDGDRRAVPASPRAPTLTDEIRTVIGPALLAQLDSPKWDDRAGALEAMRGMAEKGDTNGASPEAFLDAGSYMVMRCVADRVLPVYLSAIELALSLGTNAHSTLSTELVTRHADLWFSAMVPRTAERNARVIEATHRVLLGLAKAPSIGCRALMLHVLVVCPTKDSSGIKGRLELLEQMIEEFSFSKTSGLSLSAVMSYVRPHLEAADEKVRMAAVEVTVSCYYHKGDRTQQHVANLKPALLKILERRFAEVGTKKSSKSKKKGGVRAGARKLPELKGQNGRKLGNPRGVSRSTTSASSSEASMRQSSRGSQGSRGSLGNLHPLSREKHLPGGLRAASRGSLGSPFSLVGESHSMSISSIGSPVVNPDPLGGTLSVPAHCDSFGMSAMELNAMEINHFRSKTKDPLAPPVNHGSFTEDPMRAMPGEGVSGGLCAHTGSGSVVSPKFRNLLASEEDDDNLIQELGSDGEFDLDKAEALMDEIAGLEEM